MVAEVMPWMGLFQVADGLSGAANAIMRALALHSIGAIVNFTAYYGVGIPFGLWLTFRHHMSLVGIWIGLAVALMYGSVIGVAIVWRTNWDQGVERVRQRLGLGPLDHDSKYVDDSSGFNDGACASSPADGERSGDTSRIYRSPHAGWESDRSDRSDPGTPRPKPKQLNGKYDPERQALLA
jgi:MATE family multidrug resistance protein